MPSSFTNNFYGGNPPEQGTAKHHNTNSLTGAREIMDAAYLNNIESAIVATQSALISTQTTVNSIITSLRTASSISEVNAAASGITTL